MNMMKNVSPLWSRCANQLYSRRTIHVNAILNSTSFYEVLQVSPLASQNEIKEAYYKLSKIYHPDVAKDENSLKMFRSITEAYDTLGNVRSRIAYDKEAGLEETSGVTPGLSTSFAKDEEKGKYAPKYDKLMKKRTIQQEWEEEEVEDRYIEVQLAKHRLYVKDDYGKLTHDHRLVIFMFFVSFTWHFFYQLDTAEDRKVVKNQPDTPYFRRVWPLWFD